MMRALTVGQPWAWYIAEGLKTIENQDFLPPQLILPVGERFAIHAGRSEVDLPALRHGLDWYGVEVPYDLVRSAIVATVELAGVIYSRRWVIKHDPPTTVLGPAGLHEKLQKHELRWYQGSRYGWVLRNVRKLREPVPCGGRLQLWPLAPDMLEAVREAGG